MQPAPSPRALEPRPGVVPARKAVRPVFLGGAWVDTPIYERAALPAGQRIEGPAVIEEFGSTTVLWPGQWLEVDPHGILLIREKVSNLGNKP